MKNFKIVPTILVAFAFGSLFLNPVSTEALERISTELKEYTQNPESQIVKYEMILSSEVRSDNVRVTWTLRGNAKFVDSTKSTRRFGVETGETYTVPIEISPTGQGTAELVGVAEVFQIDGTLTSTVRTNFGFNSAWEKLPITEDYTNSKNLSNVKRVLTTVGVFVAVGAVGYFGFRRFKKWYSKTPEVKFEEVSAI